MDAGRKHELLLFVTRYLVGEARDHGGRTAASAGLLSQPSDDADDETLWLQARGLMNIRPPWPADKAFLQAQDELLQGLIEGDGIVTMDVAETDPVHPRLHLWQGDITRLAVDAIVNAANSAMTGCWAPLHYCIDNAIHTFAGVELRTECARLMDAQGSGEPTGQAKVTPAYNLPSQWVIHTVGPIANGRVTQTERDLLRSSYWKCLDAAAEVGAESIAFPCISTGVFGFPQKEAATIAIATVTEWLDRHPVVSMDVVFNVFSDADAALYRQRLDLP